MLAGRKRTDHIGQGGVQIKIHTHQADNSSALAVDGDRGGLEGFVPFVLCKIGNIGRVSTRLLNAGQHLQRQIGDGGPLPAAGVIAI